MKRNDEEFFNPSLKNVQQIELEILIEFDKICKKHNIGYVLYAGTLLGSIRHQGFIPWDDDIDVCMLRSEYDKFLEVANEDLPSDLFLQTYLTDRNYINQYAKIRKNGTLFIENNMKETEIHQGVYIDIFPFDNVRPNTIQGQIQLKYLNIIRIFAESRIKERCKSGKNKLIKYLRLMMHYFEKLLPISKIMLDKHITKVMITFNSQKTELVSDLSSTNKENYKKFTMETDDFHNTITRKFETAYFPVPINYDLVLKRGYGDYMTLPLINERKSHHNVLTIDTDKITR